MGFLREKYKKQIFKEIINRFDIKNVNCVPKLEKISLNIGIGKESGDKKIFDNVCSVLSKITGQKPFYRHAKKAISGFSLKEGQLVGVGVTLRGENMYAFLEKLIYLSLPRVRDFKGFSSKSFDKNYNFCFGLDDLLVFNELSVSDCLKTYGVNIIFNIKNAVSKEQAMYLLKCFDFPIR